MSDDLTPEQLKAKREKARTSFENLLRRACRSTMPHRILEWGPGSSTSMMMQECPGARILSLEHDKKWFDKQVVRLGKGRSQDEDEHGIVHLRRNDSEVAVAYRPISMKGGRSKGYVNFPLYLQQLKAEDVMPGIGEGFHLVFVDGRFRFDCLMAARQVVSHDGVVILHDAQRTNYHPPYRLFKHRYEDEGARTTVLCDQPLTWIDAGEEVWWTLHDDGETIDELTNRFHRYDQPFSYVRFGDADLYFINDPWFDKNRRHQPKTTRFSEELTEALCIDHPDYLIGSAAMTGWGRASKHRELKRIVGKYYHRKEFWSAVCMHVSFLQNFKRFQKFLELFQGRKVGLIGGKTVCRSSHVRKAFNVQETEELSDTNAYDTLDDHMDAACRMADRCDVMVSALGQATRILAKRLWTRDVRGVQYFDVGSVVDALAGVKTRSWITKNQEQVDRQRAVWND